MRFIKLFDDIIKYVLMASILIIIGLSCFNIALRWFELGLSFIEPLVRHLVFFCSFLGAILAIGSNQHIKIDLMQRFIQKRKYFKRIVNVIYFVVILLVLSALTYSSYRFTLSEFEYGKISFLSIHSGYLTSIIPFGFILMTFRHILRLFEQGES